MHEHNVFCSSDNLKLVPILSASFLFFSFVSFYISVKYCSVDYEV